MRSVGGTRLWIGVLAALTAAFLLVLFLSPFSPLTPHPAQQGGGTAAGPARGERREKARRQLAPQAPSSRAARAPEPGSLAGETSALSAEKGHARVLGVGPQTSKLEVRGVVLDSETLAPVPSATVSILVPLDPEQRRRLQVSRRGTFRAAVPRAPRYQIEVEAPGYQAHVDRRLSADRPFVDLRILLHPLFAIGGVVEERDSGRGIAGAAVWAKRAGAAKKSAFSFADARGRFTLKGIKARGVYRLGAAHPAFEMETGAEVSVPAARRVRITMRAIEDPGSLLGNVKDAVSGSPIPGAIVWLTDRRDLSYRAASDRDGVYRIPAIRAGRYYLVCNAEGYAKSFRHQREIEVESGLQSRANFLLDPASDFEGVVENEQGSPLSGAQVLLEFGRKPEVSSLELTDEEGHFLFRKLRPGPYRAHVTHADYMSQSFSVRVPAREEARFVLQPGVALTAVVEDERGAPFTQFDFILISQADHRRYGTFHIKAVDGRFELSGLRPQSYTFAIHVPGGRHYDWGAAIDLTADLEVLIILDSRSGETSIKAHSP